MTEQQKPATREAPKRSKMTLSQQVEFLWYIIERCKVRRDDGSKAFSRETWMRLTADEVRDLQTVRDTLHTFEIYGADKFVRNEVMKLRKGRSRR
jgi:hypothetical protein